MDTVLQPEFARAPAYQLVIAGSLIIFWLVWRLDQILKTAAQCPSQVVLKRYPTILGRSLSGLLYLVSAPKMLLDQYHTGIPYAVRTLEDFNVHVSSAEHIRELSEAPEDELSLHAVAKDMLQPKYTMNGLGVHDAMRANGSVHNRVLRVLLRSNLPLLQSGLQAAIAASFAKELALGTVENEGFIRVQSFVMAKNIVVQANSQAFFGRPLSEDPTFLQAALQYPEDVFLASEALRFTPSILARKVAALVTKQGRASRVLVGCLTPIVEDRLKERRIGSICQENVSLDLLQWMVDTTPRKEPWSAEKIVQVILGIWFASVHQLAMSVVYGLYDLCQYTDYIEPLRKEFQDQAAHVDNMPLMDSFLKESARLNPSDSISLRRKALVPYTFSDGTHVPAGNVVCVPLRAILRDPMNYCDAHVFNGFRFVDEDKTGSVSKLVEGEPKFLLWGLGKRSCPGRYYAVHALKLIIGHVLSNYEFKLADEKGPRTFSWRSATVPLSSTALLLRKRSL